MIHPASLVAQSTHSKHLLRLVNTKLTGAFIDYLVSRVAATVDYALSRPQSFNRPSATLTKFTAFATTVLKRAEVSTATVLTTLVYIERARPHLHIALEEWALERVFLGALITASKYTNDSTLKNVHWALCTGVFGKRDVGRIEREFLEVLDWELGIKESEILDHYEPVMLATAVTLSRPPLVRGRQLRAPVVPEDAMDTDDDEDDFSDDSSDGSSSPHTPPSSAPLTFSTKRKAPPTTTSTAPFGTLLKSFHHSQLHPQAIQVHA